MLTFGIAALATSAVVNRHLANKAERQHPAYGRFLDLDGVRLHYTERGRGEPLILLHGNGSMLEDFESSGLIKLAAKQFRVIAFDRPGFGRSSRPRGTVWTPNAQADLIHAALRILGVEHATVLGHSWGASVAIALGIRFPALVSSLILASGYYYPTIRADVPILAAPAIPVFGDLLSYTVSPVLSRALWPLLLRKLFGPAPVPEKFRGFSREMAVRPSQIRAGAAEAALMIPDAFGLSGAYRELKMPVVIVAGEDDRLIDIDRQSARLHQEVTQSTFHRLPRVGHMVHQTSTDAVMSAIIEASERARDQRASEILPIAA
jgi:pimeloyl-ACP methyl ester carboxylesterase